MPAYYEWHRPREDTVSVSASTDVHSGDYVCDGTADQVEINAALTYVSGLGGGSVVCLQGAYELAATVNVPANCTLNGVGWSTIFNYDAGGNCITITGDNAKVRDLKVDIIAGAGAGGTRPNCVYAASRTNLELFGLWLVGDETVADDGSDIRQCGVVFSAMTDSSILSCVSQDQKRHGVNLASECDYNRIAGNNSEGNTRHGIYLSGSDNNTIAGNICQDNAQSGIYITSSDQNALAGNICQGNTSNGIYADSINNTYTGNICRGNSLSGMSMTGGSDNAISTNMCQGNTRYGIELIGSGANTLSGNTCHSNGRYGIVLSSASDNTIVGNSCNDNDSGDTGTYDGIKLGGSNNNLVSENTCKDNDRNGILVDVNSTRNVIEGNYCDGNGHHGISCAGNDSQINDNRCFDNGQKAAQTYHGIVLVSGTFRCNLVGNHCDSPGDSQEDGIHLTGTNSGCSLVGNWCYSGMGSGIYIGGGSDQQVHGNYCQDNDDYGIELNGCTGVHVKDNLLNSNDTAEYLENACTDIAIPEIWAPFAFEDATQGYRPVVTWTNGADTTAYCTLQIPLDFQQLVSANAVVIPAASGNLYWLANSSYGKICADQQEDAHTDAIGVAAQAVTDDELECLDIFALFDNLDLGDNAGVQVSRIGTDELDTVAADVYAVGVRLRYV